MDDLGAASDVGLYLYDSEDRQFETDGDMFGYVPEDKDIFLLERINPGMSHADASYGEGGASGT
jgi:hypothetical protein